MVDRAAHAGVRHCVILPFYGRLAMVARCLAGLLAQATPHTVIVLVDDGSPTPPARDPDLAPLLDDARVILLRHDGNRGVAAARNTALEECRRQAAEIVLMIDSDCEPTPDFIAAHLRLHAEHPETACIGAAVEGVGDGFWARLDRVMTWVHQIGPAREVKHPYHLGTTNFSAKLARLPARRAVFDERLNTGEDALLIRELHRTGQRAFLFPAPRIRHRDRDTFAGLLWHHYQYGQHQYFVQLGGDLAPRCFHPLYRVAFVLVFAPLVPLYALMGSLLNLALWLPAEPGNVRYYPFMYLLWLAKGVAVLQSAVSPRSTLRSPSPVRPAAPAAVAPSRADLA